MSLTILIAVVATGVWGEQRLDARIRQRVPAYLTHPAEDKRKDKDKTPASAIGEHLVKNLECLDSFDRDRFTTLAAACTETKLYALEALYIKTLSPELCKQKEFVANLQLF